MQQWMDAQTWTLGSWVVSPVPLGRMQLDRICQRFMDHQAGRVQPSLCNTVLSIQHVSGT